MIRGCWLEHAIVLASSVLTVLALSSALQFAVAEDSGGGEHIIFEESCGFQASLGLAW